LVIPVSLSGRVCIKEKATLSFNAIALPNLTEEYSRCTRQITLDAKRQAPCGQFRPDFGLDQGKEAATLD